MNQNEREDPLVHQAFVFMKSWTFEQSDKPRDIEFQDSQRKSVYFERLFFDR